MRYCCTQCGATNIRMKKRREGQFGCAIVTLMFIATAVGVLIERELIPCDLRLLGIFAEYYPEQFSKCRQFVLIFTLIPLVIYWLFAKTTIVCRKCKGENCLVPMKSPRGQEILYGGVGQNGGGNPRLVQAKKIIIKKKIVFKKPVVNVDKEK